MYPTTVYNASAETEATRVSTLSVHAFSIHFYLRDRHAKNQTSVLAVVRQKSKRIKISLSISVNPRQWDNRKERLYLLDSKSLECNKQLSNIHCHLENLCLSLQDIKKVKIYFSDDFSMATRYNRDEVNVERVLRDAFRMYYDEKKAKGKAKDSTINDRHKRLNKLCRIIKDEMDCNSSAQFISNGYEELKDFVVDKEGEYSSGANGMCELFAILLNHVRTKPKFSKYSIEPINHKRFNSQKSFKTNLYDTEIRALEDLQLDDRKENDVRYRFLIEAECGSRNSDLSKVIELVKGLDVNKKTKAYKELKEGRTAVAVNTERLQFYMSQLSDSHDKISCTYANQLLKVIARKANLNRTIETMDNKPLCDCISTHFGRHTFVTNMLRKGYTQEDVIKFTGHASTDMVRRIYAHLSEQDFEDDAERIIDRVEGDNQPQQPNIPPILKTLPNSIDEAKQVLCFLGVNTEEYITITDIETLLKMVSVYEHQIIQGFDIRRLECIKEIFNEDADIRVRKEHLHNLISEWYGTH